MNQTTPYSSLIESFGFQGAEAISILVADSISAVMTVSRSTTDIPNIEDWPRSTTVESIQAGIDALTSSVGSTDLEITNRGSELSIGTSILLKDGVRLRGRGKPVLKLAAGANCDIVQTPSVYTLFGSGAVGSKINCGLVGLRLDGNSANQSPADPDQCNGIAVYAHGYVLDDLELVNIKGNGLRLKSYAAPVTEHPLVPHKSQATRLTIYNCGRHGMDLMGPSDSYFASIEVRDASIETDNTYDGVHVSGSGAGRFFDVHPWHSSGATNRMRYSAYLADDCAGATFHGCHLEGGRRQLYLGTGGYHSFYGGLIYAPYSDNAQIVMKGPHCTIHAPYKSASGSTNPSPKVLQIGSGVSVFGYDIRMSVHVFDEVTKNEIVAFNSTDDVGGALELYVTGCGATALETGTRHKDTRGFIFQSSPARVHKTFGPIADVQLKLVTANTTFVVPKGFMILAVMMENVSANAVTGGIRIGTTDGGADVIAAQALAAFTFAKVADSALLKSKFSGTADTTLYLQAVTSWNSATANIQVVLSNAGMVS